MSFTAFLAFFGSLVGCCPVTTMTGTDKSKNPIVFKATGALQCEADSGISESQARKELEAAGVKVLDYHQSTDGQMYAPVCGASAGTIHVFKIRSESLTDARKAGYELYDANSGQ